MRIRTRERSITTETGKLEFNDPAPDMPGWWEGEVPDDVAAILLETPGFGFVKSDTEVVESGESLQAEVKTAEEKATEAEKEPEEEEPEETRGERREREREEHRHPKRGR